MRTFIPSPLIPHTTLLLEGTEFHHLVHVMRSKVGDEIEIVNGQGEVASGLVISVGKQKGVIQIETLLPTPPSLQMTLIQALAKPNHLDFILEKGTELGVSEFILFPGEKSSRESLSSHQQQRYQALLISALKQCKRATLPTLRFLPPLIEWKSLPVEGSYFGDLRNEAPSLWNLLQTQKRHATYAFINGPESGWSDRELTQLIALGAQGVSLHTSTLRTETAAITALALLAQPELMAYYGKNSSS